MHEPKKVNFFFFTMELTAKFNLPQELLIQFYSAIIEPVLCTSITVWFSSATKSDHRRLRRVVQTAEQIIGTTIPTLQELYLSRVSKSLAKSLWTRVCERSWAVRISAPRSRGCSLPGSTAQSRTRSLRSITLPAHLQFHPTPVKSFRARSNLKLLCMSKTCRFQPKPYASDTLSAWQTWSGFVAWLLRKKSASLLFCRGAAVAAWLDHTWYARIPQAMWLL